MVPSCRVRAGSAEGRQRYDDEFAKRLLKTPAKAPLALRTETGRAGVRVRDTLDVLSVFGGCRV